MHLHLEYKGSTYQMLDGMCKYCVHIYSLSKKCWLTDCMNHSEDLVRYDQIDTYSCMQYRLDVY